ncbi:hypothetical protein VTO73DRAFT_5873 [Trametes versicolor]
MCHTWLMLSLCFMLSSPSPHHPGWSMLSSPHAKISLSCISLGRCITTARIFSLILGIPPPDALRFRSRTAHIGRRQNTWYAERSTK